jgi:phospholipase C
MTDNTLPETGGFGDHVIPYHSPSGTAGEWITDPYGKLGSVYTGPGFRLPFYIVSPWTRGGHVFTENSDHISQIKFVESWLAAKGIDVVSDQIPAWRRAHMSDLTKAFDFSNPDYSLPVIPDIAAPSTDSTGAYNGYAVCEATYKTQRPPVPYGQQNADISALSEQGFKSVRGALTEGRFLVFELNGFALTNCNGELVTSKASAKHDSKAQRWVVHQSAPGSTQFQVSSAVDGKYVTAEGTCDAAAAKAVSVTVTDLGNGKGYDLNVSGAGYLSVDMNGKIGWSSTAIGFGLFSVTYDY